MAKLSETIPNIPIPFGFAGLCVDCEHVVDIRLADGCGRCGNPSLLMLHRVLGARQ